MNAAGVVKNANEARTWLELYNAPKKQMTVMGSLTLFIKEAKEEEEE